MPPKKHIKFSDDGEVASKRPGDLKESIPKKQKNAKKQKISNEHHRPHTNSMQEQLPGPLNLARLEAIENREVTLTDNDLHFHTSSSAESSASGDEEPRNKRKGNVVTFYDEEDEDEVRRDVKRDKKSLKQTREKLMKDRRSLPIFQSREQVLRHVMNNRVTVLLGETGSGKSTQLPQLIYDLDPKHERIAITQPRRVAAINLATRVAEECGCQVGTKVGYTVRFANKSNSSTKIKYLTDGMLMRELLLDQDLKQYTTIILDEAHERTVLTDLLMGLMKRLLRKRADLRLVVMSATLDADKFAKFFDNAPVVFVEGKTYPVQRLYLREPIDDAVDGVVQAVCQTNLSEPDGDILVFLAGQEEIEKCVDKLNSISPGLPKEAPHLLPLPLYASLAPAAQQRAFEPAPEKHRKIILATNIAETSLTIPGVRYVIDSGLRKVRVWKPELGLDTLLTTAISQASAAQRMGRAGREAAGKCFRLFSEATYAELSQQTEPEIMRCDIASTVLTLKRAGVDDVLGFDWVEAPRQRAIESALLKLYTLKALDDEGQITTLGMQMVLLPVAPQLAAVLISAQKESQDLLYQVIDIVSCLSVEDLLVSPHPDQRDDVNERRAALFPTGRELGDLVMLKELLNQYRGLFKEGLDKRERREWCKQIAVNPRGMDNVQLVRKQLCKYMKLDSNELGSGDCSNEQIIRCFLKGYLSNTALGLPDRRFKTTTHQQFLNIHPSSMMFGTKPEAIMYMEYVFTTKGYARTVSPIDITWLDELAPHLLGRARANDSVQ